MKNIKVGSTNDLHLYAVEIDGVFFPLDEQDLDHETPDVKIYYDSGVYPSISDIPHYICAKASISANAAAALGSLGGSRNTPAQNAARAANAKHAGRPKGSKNKPK
jgi:hypothetical protein